MLYLEKSLYIGQGEDRECYLHPEDSKKCIKITTSGDYKQSNDEISFYKLIGKRGASYDHLSTYHGLVQTNRGEGLVFSLIRDYDSAVSKSVGHYLSTKTYALNEFKSQLDSLKNYLLNQLLIIRDLSPDNILFQKISEHDGKLIIIDGVGNNEFIPFSTYIDFLARRKIIRKWAKFEALLLHEYDWKTNNGTTPLE